MSKMDSSQIRFYNFRFSSLLLMSRKAGRHQQRKMFQDTIYCAKPSSPTCVSPRPVLPASSLFKGSVSRGSFLSDFVHRLSSLLQKVVVVV
jgi:hypothetical protein